MDLGKHNLLTAASYTSVGLFLEDENGERVLLPMKWVPKGVSEGEKVEVFIYRDNEERPIATTLPPKATVGDFAFLQVRQMTKLGAFMDWGMEKDLFVPFKEQQERMEAGQWYVVYVYIDEKTGRITASGKVDKFAEKPDQELSPKDEVDLLIVAQTDLGYKVVINNRYMGLVYENEVYDHLHIGNRKKGYIKNIREDGKIDVSLQKPGYGHVEPNAQKILSALEKNEGFLPLHDKSAPEEITAQLQMSKKTFKKAIGSLYKQKLISLEEGGVRLL